MWNQRPRGANYTYFCVCLGAYTDRYNTHTGVCVQKVTVVLVKLLWAEVPCGCVKMQVLIQCVLSDKLPDGDSAAESGCVFCLFVSGLFCFVLTYLLTVRQLTFFPPSQVIWEEDVDKTLQA